MRSLHEWVIRRESDPVPGVLTVAGSIVSLGALATGLLLDSEGLTLNIVANLVLIGPALVLSNFIVRWVRDARTAHEIEPLRALAAAIASQAIEPAQRCIEMLQVDRDLHTPEPLASSLEQVVQALDDAEKAVREAIGNPGSGFQQSLPLSGEAMHFPSFASLLRIVELINLEKSNPFAVLVANAAVDWSRGVSVEFVTSGIVEPRIGLADIATWSQPSLRGGGTHLGSRSLFDCVLGCIDRTRAVLLAVDPELRRGS